MQCMRNGIKLILKRQRFEFLRLTKKDYNFNYISIKKNLKKNR